MGYVNPHEPDAVTRKTNGVLSRRQSREDFLAARAEGGFDAAMHDSKRPERPTVYADEGWKRPKGMSRSGAMTPQTRSGLENAEARGEIELLRNVYGHIEAYRPID